MKKLLGCIALAVASTSAFADAPGGPGCGWGNMLFEGQSGFVPHFAATTTNGTSGNHTFGMTSGTNGCSVNGKLTYGGKKMISSIMTEFSADVAMGQGDALNAVAVIMGVEQQDRRVFAEVTHANFKVLFPTENTTAEEVVAALEQVMKADSRLAKYVI
jgi:ascorbate-specific PTS system EIIC-type component UlaA